jgi:hypothetical protein
MLAYGMFDLALHIFYKVEGTKVCTAVCLVGHCRPFAFSAFHRG